MVSIRAMEQLELIDRKEQVNAVKAHRRFCRIVVPSLAIYIYSSYTHVTKYIYINAFNCKCCRSFSVSLANNIRFQPSKPQIHIHHANEPIQLNR